MNFLAGARNHGRRSTGRFNIEGNGGPSCLQAQIGLGLQGRWATAGDASEPDSDYALFICTVNFTHLRPHLYSAEVPPCLGLFSLQLLPHSLLGAIDSPIVKPVLSSAPPSTTGTFALEVFNFIRRLKTAQLQSLLHSLGHFSK